MTVHIQALRADRLDSGQIPRLRPCCSLCELGQIIKPLGFGVSICGMGGMTAPASMTLVINEHMGVEHWAGHRARHGGVSTLQGFLNYRPALELEETMTELFTFVASRFPARDCLHTRRVCCVVFVLFVPKLVAEVGVCEGIW